MMKKPASAGKQIGAQVEGEEAGDHGPADEERPTHRKSRLGRPAGSRDPASPVSPNGIQWSNQVERQDGVHRLLST